MFRFIGCRSFISVSRLRKFRFRLFDVPISKLFLRIRGFDFRIEMHEHAKAVEATMMISPKPLGPQVGLCSGMSWGRAGESGVACPVEFQKPTPLKPMKTLNCSTSVRCKTKGYSCFDWMAMPRALRASRHSKNEFRREVENLDLEHRTRKQQSVGISTGYVFDRVAMWDPFKTSSCPSSPSCHNRSF
jgi:hypothetical protein